MAYTSFSAVASANALLDDVATFAGLNGWTVHQNAVHSGSARTITLSPDGSGPYLTLESYDYAPNADIYPLVHRNYTAGNYGAQTDTNLDTGFSSKVYSELLTFPVATVHVFCNRGTTTEGDSLYIVIEEAVGFFRYILMGRMSKFGTYPGGTFYDLCGRGVYEPSNTGYRGPDRDRAPFTAHESSDSFSPAMFRGFMDGCDDTGSPRWSQFTYKGRSFDSPTDGNQCGDLTNNVFTMCVAAGGIPFNGRSAMYKPVVYVHTYKSISGFPIVSSPYGQPPNFRFANMKYVGVGQEVISGSETWKFFPLTRKSDPISPPSDSRCYSAHLGLAFRK